jgi:hypothetical protein
MDLALVGLVGHRDGKLVRMSTWRSEDAYTGIRQSSEDRYAPSVLSPRRKASQDTATTATCRFENREWPGVGGASTGTCSGSGSGSG